MLNISASRRSNRPKPGLDIAPLIDMVFILLIFFLVNTSYVKETGIEVIRPTAATATAAKIQPFSLPLTSKTRCSCSAGK